MGCRELRNRSGKVRFKQGGMGSAQHLLGLADQPWRRSRQPAISQAMRQNKSGMALNAIRVGAALYAVSIAAGARVLMPYLSLI